ncbi:MAG: cobalamin biosynthesis protein CbiG [Syntrophobacteraceae bacterium]
MALFDAYIFIDWSAANKPAPIGPGVNQVWIGERIPPNSANETSYRTRYEGVSSLTCRLLEHIKNRHRVLVGFDFPYGYPSGLNRALRLPVGPQSWRAVWKYLAKNVQDNVLNVNNRFVVAGQLNTLAGGTNSGPFWGCPVGAGIANLQPFSPGFSFNAMRGVSLERLRIVETRLPGIQEAWKLFGRGSVGGQALVGIPYLYMLRHHLGLNMFSKVWPFETQFVTSPSPGQGPFILHAEIWPGVVRLNALALMAANPGLVPDQAQVRAMCEWAAN